VHFCVLGIALIALERRFSPPGREEIVVSASALRGLHADHLRRTGVPPTPAEEAALVRRLVEDEVLYREALARGLDRGDVIVRRRLRQKMEFLLEDSEPAPVPPAEAELAAWLAANPARYARPERLTLTHVFVDGARPDAESTARALVARLTAGAEPTRLGDPFLRGREFAARTEAELAAVFGPALARAVAALPVGVWSEPLRSSYGLHLVRVSTREAGGPAALSEVRDAVARDRTAATRVEARRKAVEHLRRKYTVRITGGTPETLAAAR
jgi:hypothetical protein